MSNDEYRANGNSVVRGDAVVAGMTSRGWLPIGGDRLIREAIFAVPNDAGAAEVAREANRRQNEQVGGGRE